MESKQFFIHNIHDFVGQTVIVKGWVYNLRSSGSLIFLQLRDGTGFVQTTVIKSEVPKTVFDKAKKITLETSVIIRGIIRADKRSPSGFELTVKDLIIVSLSEDYPIGKKEHGPDFLLTHRHLWLRSRKQWAIQRIRNVIIYSIYSHLEKEGFIKIDAPILTPNACEGTTTLFPVPYLPAWKDPTKPPSMRVSLPDGEIKKEEPYAFLSQSGQLYIEAAIFSHGKVFDFGPTFRAEKSKTRRHLTEFWMMDAEMAFSEHKDNMKAQEKLIIAVVQQVLDKCAKELEIIGRDVKPLEKILKGGFPVITHKEAIEIVRKEGIAIGKRDDFGAESETILSNKFDKPLFIEKYPKEVKAFYMKEDPDDTSRVLNDDLIAPEGYGEIIGGSQREDSYERLLQRMKELNYSIADYEWYLDLRKYGSVPHSGYGIGLERLVAWICKLDHLRESIPFPRMMERFNP
ncbi:asparagine--tRNA ligase [Candidatus Gottesmanbacteria bacterium CG11_big_fil_rev_8_21_14_0_20_37_11]|uniref:Asparagine--tRNA ligase n=3 Tax=Candidatus Gottesmaniibacteriota TaxID=1752720 RepID=A0A2M7RSF0_9BACT|nr:MAG: asparagine--tRNA ligase [Candidatus Gottesmanbacteria bacterium CG1_02_37_22]PIP32917.1 MAG: asparagine--tRNA ligase [Candidatus Gottesmanbacteria bacterium CG23_combo_of_CG06-09_8_20_14_all_37_19]PIR07956.1 MAG: asparagine--tRNA ligase [Candidatus Gottesmanbacteria bacterium CG11_big_fil_rev_8_21_14_0_20_37_11]PIZ03248.1 MAG: asparagine--tRNA ligase [Candidatus Gottesmanbacteria bacterium CG_4_10_14_0_8_um_filter_37_24]